MRSIPSAPRAHLAVDEARRLLCLLDVQWLPVDPLKIARQMGFRLLTVSQVAETAKVSRRDVINGQDCAIWWSDGCSAIVYDETSHSKRIYFSVAHELGHFVLRHLRDYKQTSIFSEGLTSREYWVFEREANIFATELLMPFQILQATGATTQQEIADICQVSMHAAKVRADEMRRSFALPEDERIISQFHRYLEPVAVCASVNGCLLKAEKTKNAGVTIMNSGKPLFVLTDKNSRFIACPQCGNSKFSQDANFCRMCGLYLYNCCGNLPTILHEDGYGDFIAERVNSGDARYCEHCGEATMLTRLGLVMSWEEVKQAYGEIESALAPEHQHVEREMVTKS